MNMKFDSIGKGTHYTDGESRLQLTVHAWVVLRLVPSSYFHDFAV